MSHRSVALSRTTFVLLVRGAFLIAFGAIAVRWPEETLVSGMGVAGAVAGSLGIFEIAAAVMTPMLWSTRAFLVGNGLVYAGFGVLTAFVPASSVHVASNVTALWLQLHATFVGLLAGRMWYCARARYALVLWGAVNLGCALAVVAFPAPATLTLLYDGALYTFALGVAQVVAGRWMQRGHFGAFPHTPQPASAAGG